MELHLLVDGKNSMRKINAIPGETQYLPLTQACKQRYQKKVLKPVAFDSLHKRHDLIFV